MPYITCPDHSKRAGKCRFCGHEIEVSEEYSIEGELEYSWACTGCSVRAFDFVSADDAVVHCTAKGDYLDSLEKPIWPVLKPAKKKDIPDA